MTNLRLRIRLCPLLDPAGGAGDKPFSSLYFCFISNISLILSKALLNMVPASFALSAAPGVVRVSVWWRGKGISRVGKG